MKKRILITTIFILTLLSFNTVFAKSNSEIFETVLKETGLYDTFSSKSSYSTFLSDINKYDNIQVSTYSKNGWTDGSYSLVVRVWDFADDLYAPTSNSITASDLVNGCYYQCQLYNAGFWNFSLSETKSNFNLNQSSYYYYYTNCPTVDNPNGQEGGTSGKTIFTIENPEPETPLPGSGDNIEGDVSGDFQATLPAIVEKTNPEEVLAEIVGLLPIVMVCLVSFLGLRKALILLSDLLHKS